MPELIAKDMKPHTTGEALICPACAEQCLGLRHKKKYRKLFCQMITIGRLIDDIR
jgi:hypothetical protein